MGVSGCKLPCADLSRFGLFLLPHFVSEIKRIQGTNFLCCKHTYLHNVFSEIVTKHAPFYILFLQRKGCLTKKKSLPERCQRQSRDISVLASGNPVDFFLFNQIVGFFFTNNAISVRCVLVASPGDRRVESTGQCIDPADQHLAHQQWKVILG